MNTVPILQLNVDHEYSLFPTRRPGPDYVADVAVIVVNVVSTCVLLLLVYRPVYFSAGREQKTGDTIRVQSAGTFDL